MSSKREEERNEKIIRGLMKLPPNRKCINCHSLDDVNMTVKLMKKGVIELYLYEFEQYVENGPQYVCTNFWTFVCTTCSGIHREFTHRVKSVSMAKFTSQEVEALQKGGNQRARESYLVHWDPQKQRQPNSSNAEKVREFIKHVYVDKKYAADKPPRDTQNLGHPEEETRRASSYHSYSQSPPYDTQYEERRYGRQLPVLTRKPGSDRGLYDGKVSTFSSPSRFSVSSPIQSPNSQTDGRVKSPYQTTDNTAKENVERFHRTQRPTSSSSFGSFDSNSMSFKSNNSVTLADLVSAPVILQDKHYVNPSLQQSASVNFGGLDLFDTPHSPNNVIQSSPIDLFQLPEAQSKAPVDLFESSAKSSVTNVHAQKPSETTHPSSNFTSQMPPQPQPATMSKQSPDDVFPKNEGWATFDFPQSIPPNGVYIEKVEPLPKPSTALHWPLIEGNNVHQPNSIHSPAHEPNRGYIENVEPLPSTDQWAVFEGSNPHEHMSEHNLAYEPTSMNNQWHGEPYKSQVSFTNTQQTWDAFEEPTRQLSHSSTQQCGQEVVGQSPFAAMDQHLGGFKQAGSERVALDSRPPITSIPFHVETHPHLLERKSSNPFELSDDFDFQSSNMYLNMTSLQDTLPSGQFPNSFVDDVTQSWFAHNPTSHYIPATQQGALGYMGGPVANAQIPNVPTQEPVASVGGNPFA